MEAPESDLAVLRRDIARLQEEKRTAEEEKRRAEEEKRRAEEEKRAAEEGKRAAEEEKRAAEDEIDRLRLQLQQANEEARARLPELQLPLFVNAPSSASEHTIASRFRRGSATVHRLALDALRVMEAPNEVEALRVLEGCEERGTQYKRAAQQIMKDLERLTKGSALFSFKHGGSREETASAIMAARLGQHTTDHRLCWLHQAPCSDGGAATDVALYVDGDAGLWPVAAFEIGKAESDKKNQALAYAANLWNQSGAGSGVIFVAELYLNRKRDALVLRATALGTKRNAADSNDPTSWQAEVWQGELTSETLTRVLVCMDAAARERLGHAPSQWRVMGPNCAIDNRSKLVYKCFDYRGQLISVPLQAQRRPEYYLSCVKGCEFVITKPNLQLIRYPFIEGGHVATSSMQIATLIVCCQLLHERGICHGDIRLYNVLFCAADDTACLIDFDFAGKAGDKQYPLGYNANIRDGARHLEARAGRPLEFVHDVFALAALMKTHQPKDDQFKDKWEQAISHVMQNQLREAVQVLRECKFDLSIKPMAEDDEATGSPPRK